MSVKLQLSLRDAPKQLVFGASTIDSLATMPDGKLLAKVREWLEIGATEHVHDIVWLRQIIDFVPEGGHAMTEMAKWMKLATLAVKLREDVPYSITLSPFYVDLIWARLTNPEFKLRGMPAQFAEFVMNFQKTTGKHFPGEPPDLDDDLVVEEQHE